MDLEKMQNQVVSLVESNKDLIEAFKELREFETPSYNSINNKLIKLVNALCMKTKRQILKLKIEKKDIYIKDDSIGVNSKGLGTIKSWASQISVFGGVHRWDMQEDIKIIKQILNNEGIFLELLGIVDKYSVKDLKKLKDYYSNNNRGEIEDSKMIIYSDDKKENLEINLKQSGLIDNLKFVDENESIIKQYYGGDSPEDILNGERLVRSDGMKVLDKICPTFLETNFEIIRILIYVFEKKKEIKKLIKEEIKKRKDMEKECKKEDKFLSSILNPIIAVDNL